MTWLHNISVTVIWLIWLTCHIWKWHGSPAVNQSASTWLLHLMELCFCIGLWSMLIHSEVNRIQSVFLPLLFKGSGHPNVSHWLALDRLAPQMVKVKIISNIVIMCCGRAGYCTEPNLLLRIASRHVGKSGRWSEGTKTICQHSFLKTLKAAKCDVIYALIRNDL